MFIPEDKICVSLQFIERGITVRTSFVLVSSVFQCFGFKCFSATKKREVFQPLSSLTKLILGLQISFHISNFFTYISFLSSFIFKNKHGLLYL